MKSKKWLDIEEALGVLWTHRERGDRDQEKLKIILDGISADVLRDLREHKLVAAEQEEITLTAEGEEIGRDVTRRHRLAERLLQDVIEVKGAEVEETACGFEHVISPDVTDAICTLLGHPRVCPHGLPIPPGECCTKAQANIESIVVALDRMSVGETGHVAYILTERHPHLHKLLSLGIVPGTEIRLHQNAPSFVITLGETQIALDAGVAKQIYVRRK